MGSDFMLFWVLIFVISALAAAVIANLFNLSFHSMWVIVPGVIIGLSSAIAVIWKLHKKKEALKERRHRERIEIATAETERKLGEMRGKAPNIPTVQK
jgi:predicted RND superfamily exporter protein